MLPAAKASTGLSIAFPDVCKTPSPPPGSGGVPIPYPNIASTAQKKQLQKQQKVGGAASKQGFASASRGNEPGTLKDMTTFGNPASAAAKSEIGLLKSRLSTLNAKLLALPARDPNEWQAVLADYLVLASALYLTQSDD